MFEYLKVIVYAILVIGFLFYIISSAVRTANYFKRIIITSSIGLVIMIYFAIGFISDLDKQLSDIGQIRNIVILAATFIYTLAFDIYYFVNAKKYHHHLGKPSQYRQNNNIEQYLYILYRYQDKYLLKKEEDTFAADIVKFERKCFFYDEMIKKHFTKHHIEYFTDNMHGTATVYKKKKVTFYCHEVELSSIPEYLSDYQAVHRMDLINVNLQPFHKNLIFRMLLNEPFNIEL